MTIDKKINLGLRLLLCSDQEYGEACKGCPYGNGEESVSGCRTRLYQDIMVAMTTPATDDHTVDSSKKKVKDLISNILNEIGVSAENCGYSYLQEAIEYAVYNPAAINSLVYDLYPHVGKAFGVSGSAAERGMRNSINKALERFGFEHFARILRIPTQPYRSLPASQIIATIADMVRREIGA